VTRSAGGGGGIRTQGRPPVSDQRFSRASLVARNSARRVFVVSEAGREVNLVPAFCVLLVPESNGVPLLNSIEADELPFVGEFIRIDDTLAEVTHVWPGQEAELRAVTRPRLATRQP